MPMSEATWVPTLYSRSSTISRVSKHTHTERVWSAAISELNEAYYATWYNYYNLGIISNDFLSSSSYLLRRTIERQERQRMGSTEGQALAQFGASGGTSCLQTQGSHSWRQKSTSSRDWISTIQRIDQARNHQDTFKTGKATVARSLLGSHWYT